MFIADLNPKYLDFILIIDCPCQRCGSRVRIYVGPEQTTKEGKCVWKSTGTFPALTLSPSLKILPWEGSGEHKDRCPGWHGFIVDGELRPC